MELQPREAEADEVFDWALGHWRDHGFGWRSIVDRSHEHWLGFVGLNGWVAALDRDTGEIVWYNRELNSGYTTLLLDGDRLIVSTNGYLYCLDPQNGKIVWKNPMTGYGTLSSCARAAIRSRA